jgi:MFS family permease
VPRLPSAVYILQAGLLVNAFGNGAANPFLLLYLHDVRRIPLGLAGLVPATNACVALITALAAGSLADRRGAVPTMVCGLACSATAFCLYPFVHDTWQALPLAVLGGLGGGTWLTLQSSVVAAATPPELRHLAFAQQRVVANVGLGLGGLAGGTIVTVAQPQTFTRLFLANAGTFLVYAVVLLLGVRVPRRAQTQDEPRAGYRELARDGVFLRFAALNFLYCYEPRRMHLRLRSGPAGRRARARPPARPLHGRQRLLLAARLHRRPCARRDRARHRAVRALAADECALPHRRGLRARARAAPARARPSHALAARRSS